MMSFKMVRRRIIQLRFFMARASSWANTPMMAIILIGVINPYLKPYIDISFVVMFVLMVVGLISLGYIDYKLGFSKEDSSFGQEQNLLLNKKHELLNTKLDDILARLDAQNGKKEKDTIN